MDENRIRETIRGFTQLDDGRPLPRFRQAELFYDYCQFRAEYSSHRTLGNKIRRKYDNCDWQTIRNALNDIASDMELTRQEMDDSIEVCQIFSEMLRLDENDNPIFIPWTFSEDAYGDFLGELFEGESATTGQTGESVEAQEGAQQLRPVDGETSTEEWDLRDLPRPLLWAIGIVIAIPLAVWILRGLFDNNPVVVEQLPPITVEVTRVVEVVVPAPTWTPLPTATEVEFVEVVNTIEVTATYPVPTNTPEPTSTPLPTNTPTATHTPIPPMELPFSNDFSDDVDERWIGHNDNYIISGGVLKIKDGNVRFTLIGPLPEKYNIDFGYVNGRYRIMLGNQLSLVRNNGTRWEEFRDGKFVRLEEVKTSGTNIRIRIEVDGKVHRLFFDDIEQPDLIYNKEAGGDLVVELITYGGHTGITDFEISKP